MIEAGVVTVGGVKYATGLYWQPTSNGSLAKAAREAADQPGQPVDFYSPRPGTKDGRISQFGLGAKELGHKAGMPSIAVSLADQQPGSWAGVFKASDGYLFIVVRDDLIDPDGDWMFEDEAEAMARLDEEISRSGLQKIYAPSAWAVPGADEINLSILLSGRKDGKLKNVKTPAGVLAGGISILILAASGYVASGIWDDYQAQLSSASEYTRIQVQKTRDKNREQDSLSDQAAQTVARNVGQRIILSSRQPEVEGEWLPPQPYWRTAPHPVAWLNACRQTLDDIPGSVLGWQLQQLICDNTGVRLIYDRIPDSPAYYPQNNNVIVDVSGTRMSARYEFSNTLVARGGIEGSSRPQDDLWTERQVTAMILGEDWPVDSLSRMPNDPPRAANSGRPPANARPPVTPWVKRGFSMTLQYSPWELTKVFDRMPGVILRSLSVQGGTWTLEGVIYELR